MSRQQVPLAMLAPNSVNSSKITDLAIATADLADSAVTSLKIADLTIATGDLADGAVTNAKIAAATNIDLSKLNQAQAWTSGPWSSDYFRTTVSGRGLYGQADSNGVMIGSNGVYEYNSNRYFARVPAGYYPSQVNLAIVRWTQQSAPAGTGSGSTSWSVLPSPYSAIAFNHAGGTQFWHLAVQAVMSNPGYLNLGFRLDGGAPTQVSSVYCGVAGSYTAYGLAIIFGGNIGIGAHTFDWMSVSNNATYSWSMNTAIYSFGYGIEHPSA